MSRYTEHGDIDRQYDASSQPGYNPALEKNEKGDAYYPSHVAGGEDILPREEETHRALKPRQVS